MKLNLDIIGNCLSKNYRIERFGLTDQTLSLDRPYLYEVGGSFAPGRLYVLRTESLPQKSVAKDAIFICVGGQIPRGWATSSNQILLIRSTDNIKALFNEVQDIFSRYDAWDNTICSELANDIDFDIKRIILLGISALNIPFFAIDSSLQLVFSSEVQQEANGTVRIDICDEPKQLGIESGIMIKDTCDLERAIKVPYISSEVWDGHRLYCYNVYTMGHFICCSLFKESIESPMQPSDFALADYFFQHFERAYWKYLRSLNDAGHSGATTLRNLLLHLPLNTTEYEQLSLNDGESWTLFRLKGRKSTKYLPKDFMCAMLNTVMPHSVCTIIHNGDVVGLLRKKHGEKELDEQTQKFFKNLLHEMDYVAVLSNDFSDIRNIDDYYLQVSYMAENCTLDNEDQLLYYFSDYTLQYILLECVSKLPVESLYSNGLLRLLKYDQKRKADHIKSLNLYLKNEMNISKTAKALYIHRTSLIKRLEKIERLLGADLNDPNVRLYLRICFSLWENGYGDKDIPI